MITTVFVFAGIQFILSAGLLWSNTYDYNRFRNHYNKYLQYVDKNKGDRYSYNSLTYDDKECIKEMNKYSKYSRISGLALITSPVAVLAVPTMIISAVAYGVFNAISKYVIPALANKYDSV